MDKRINVTRPSMPPLDEYIEEIRGIWDSAMLTNFGPLEQKLRKELEEFLDVEALPLFVNGHQALMAAVRTLALKGRKSVITTPFTFASTTEAIAGVGLKPVFADVDPVTYTLDPAKVEALISEDTAAIVPVHVYGTLCDVEAFERISIKYNIPVIYDAAHCFGVRKNGRGVGNFGNASIFSFHATKAFNTVEGGAVAAPADIAEKIKAYTNYGFTGSGDPEIIGTNAKMNEFSAAMGICNLRYIVGVTKRRAAICEKYTGVLTFGASFDPATGISGNGFKLLPYQDGVLKNYAYFPVVFGDAGNDGSFATDRTGRIEETVKKLQDANIFPRRYFYPLTSDFPSMKEFSPAATPVAKALSDNVLCLPLYADLDLEDAEKIAKIVKG